MAVRVYLSETELRRAYQDLEGIANQVPRVMVRALNRSIVTTRKISGQEIRRELLAPATEVRNRLKLLKATKSKQRASVIATRGRIPLIKFHTRPRAPRPTKKPGGVYRPPVGLTVTTTRSEGPVTVPGAFLAVGPKAGLQVFTRTGKDRLKLARRSGPGVRDVVGSPAVMPKVSKEASATLRKRFDYEIKRLLGA